MAELVEEMNSSFIGKNVNNNNDESDNEFEEVKEFDYDSLTIIRDSIEKMNKFNQIEVLKILHNNKSVVINENKYGVHINLSQVNSNIIEELNTFVKYVNTQESYLNDVEKQKETYKNTYFKKDNKDKLKNI